MSDAWGTIHFANGEKLNVPGTTAEVQSRLTSGAGPVLFQDRNQNDVLVNPAQITHVVLQVDRRES
jgi:hypothetical protein